MPSIRLIVFSLALSLGTTALAGPGWMASFEQAQQAAQQQNVPLLIHFHAPWCGPCRQMERQVFSSPAVQRALNEGLVSVKVSTSERSDLSQRFGANTIPRDVVVYPDGTVETPGIGFIPQPSYLRILRDAAARGRTMALRQMEQEEDRQPDEPRQSAPSTQVESTPPPESDEMADDIIGLNGYCPVMLSGKRKWIKGDSQITERYRGVLYHFSSRQKREQFLKQPDLYAPRNLGCDPVVLYEDQRAVTGRIRYGAFFDGKLFLFRTAENRATFKQSPLKYTRIQHAIKPMELSGQTFL